MSGLGEAPHMVEMGAFTSVVAPVLVLALRRRISWGPLSWPAYAALPMFVLVHGAITLWMHAHEPSVPMHLLLHALLLGGAVIFWLPVLAGRHRLDPGGRAIYLFLGAPALDLAGVIVVATGDAVGGLAMIVAMLPIGLVAVALAWRWISEDERAAARYDAAHPLPGAPSPPDGYALPPTG